VKGVVEGGLAGGLALALHFGAFAMMPVPNAGSSDAAGDEGVALVSLSAADPALSARIAAWETPPALSQPNALMAPVLADDAPVLPLADGAAPTPDVPKMALPAAVDTVPRADAPPPEPAPPEPAPPEPAPTKQPAPDAVPAPVAKTAQQLQAGAQDNRAAQKAAGKGKTRAAGTTGKAEAATANGAAEQALAAKWGAAIRARIERRKTYPQAAGRAAGTVTLRLQVGADGSLLGVAVATSSGNARLDDAALRAVKNAGRLPKAPTGFGPAQASFTLPLRFER
jgi:periplasmic protein TonB